MKRAPVIPKHTLNTQPVEDTSSSAPAAPMVDSLIARVGVMAPAVMPLLCLYVVGM
jgi:ParB family chromosome partitioning protein